MLSFLDLDMYTVLKGDIIVIREFVAHLKGGPFESYNKKTILSVLTYLKDLER